MVQYIGDFMNEIKFNEVEVQKLNLQPGEVLIIKVKTEFIDNSQMTTLGQGMRKIFPNNKVIVLSVEPEGSIDLTIAKGSEYPETQFCTDCNCGKKAAYEGEGNETT